jgi:hypothetical protein
MRAILLVDSRAGPQNTRNSEFRRCYGDSCKGESDVVTRPRGRHGRTLMKPIEGVFDIEPLCRFIVQIDS